MSPFFIAAQMWLVTAAAAVLINDGPPASNPPPLPKAGGCIMSSAYAFVCAGHTEIKIDTGKRHLTFRAPFSGQIGFQP